MSGYRSLWVLHSAETSKKKHTFCSPTGAKQAWLLLRGPSEGKKSEGEKIDLAEEARTSGFDFVDYFRRNEVSARDWDCLCDLYAVERATVFVIRSAERARYGQTNQGKGLVFVIWRVHDNKYKRFWRLKKKTQSNFTSAGAGG